MLIREYRMIYESLHDHFVNLSKRDVGAMTGCWVDGWFDVRRVICLIL